MSASMLFGGMIAGIVCHITLAYGSEMVGIVTDTDSHLKYLQQYAIVLLVGVALCHIFRVGFLILLMELVVGGAVGLLAMKGIIPGARGMKPALAAALGLFVYMICVSLQLSRGVIVGLLASLIATTVRRGLIILFIMPAVRDIQLTEKLYVSNLPENPKDKIRALMHMGQIETWSGTVSPVQIGGLTAITIEPQSCAKPRSEQRWMIMFVGTGSAGRRRWSPG